MTSTTQPTPTTTGVSELLAKLWFVASKLEPEPREDIASIIVALRAALSTAPAGDGVPGMVLVPAEPTDAMYEAGAAVCDQQCSQGCQVNNIYRAMLSTASTAGKG